MLLVSESPYTKKLKNILHSKFFFFLFIMITILYALVSINQKEKKIEETNIKIIGIVKEYKWDLEQKKIEIVIKSNKKRQFLVYFYEDAENLRSIIQYGNLLEISGKRTIAKNNTIPNTFNYKRYLKSQGFDYYITVTNINFLKKGNWITTGHQKIREFLDTKQDHYYYKVLLLGIKENENDILARAYRENGISHIFVISGMHLALFYGFINKCLKKLWKKELFCTMISFCILSLYVLCLPSSISASRAYMFFLLDIINRVGKLKFTSKEIYIFNVLIHLWKNPFCIYALSFQYSFLLSFAYLFFGSHHKKKIKRYIQNSFLAFLVSLPITWNSSFFVNPWSILINVIIVPIVSMLLLPGLILSIVFPGLEFFVHLFIKGIEESNILFASLPKISVSKMPSIMICFYYFTLYLYLKTKNYKIIAIWSILFFFHLWLPKFDGNGYIYILDVGQGDSTLMISPHQKEIMLIDTGKENEMLKNNLITFFKSLGISKLDYLILTHGDLDHIGQSINIVNNFKVEKVIFNNGKYTDLELNLIRTLEEKNISYDKNVKELNLNHMKLHFLNTGLYDNENDNSNVLYFNHNHYKFLFMGDAGVNREKDILKKYNLENIDFLKVGHHGSNTSSSEHFINSIHPKYSIISVGKNNWYGHPKESVLDTLSNSKIYRTDIDGTIKIKLDWRKYKIETWSP